MTDLIGRPEDGVYVADVVDLAERAGRAARAAGHGAAFGTLPEAPVGYGLVTGQVVVDGQVVGTVDLPGQQAGPAATQADEADEEDLDEDGPASWWEREHWQVVPAAFASPERAKATMRQVTALTANRARFHGVRVPIYSWRIMRVALFGARHAIGEMWHYALAAEYAEEIRAAKRARNREGVAEAREARRAVIRERLTGGRAMACYGAAAALIWLAAEYGLVAAGGLLTTAAFFLGGRALKLANEDAELALPGLFDRFEAEGVVLTDERLTEALRDAGVLKADQEITLLGLIGRERGASVATFKLPKGATVNKMRTRERMEALASALDTERDRVHVEKLDTERTVRIKVFDEHPFAGPALRSPLMDVERWSIWKGSPMVASLAGTIELVELMWAGLLVGAQPRKGKTFTARGAAAAGVLDPYCRLVVADGKGGKDWAPLAKIAETYIRGVMPREIMRYIRTLESLVSEMQDRYDVLHDLPDEECPEGKLTPEIAVKYGMHPVLLITDEVQLHLADQTNIATMNGRMVDGDVRGAKKLLAGEHIAYLLEMLVKVGPACGLIPVLATQKSTGDAMPTAIRDVITQRQAHLCGSWQMSDSILGSGAAKAGHDASELDGSIKGLALLYTEVDGTRMVRSVYITLPELSVLCERGLALRQAVGTLYGEALERAGAVSVGGFLLDLLAAFEACDMPEAMALADLAVWLHKEDPEAGWGQGKRENPRAWTTRVGKKLAAEAADALAGTGRLLPTSKLIDADPDTGRRRERSAIALADLQTAIGA